MFDVKTREFEATLDHDGIPAVRMTLALPVISGGRPRAARRIDAFYRHMELAIVSHARRALLPRAAGLFEPYRVKLTFTFEESDGELRVARVLYADFGGDETEHRLTDVWDVKSGLLTRQLSEEVSYLQYLPQAR
ncbi:MAG: hypothetical protein LBN99_07640 [Oscillospiraceae bacterium]|jgi:hypothetical protein|nr:hypothetical protein [Oscillospiraceae bacterium]